MNNNEIFKPENKNISDIFSFTGIYTIPNYQRQYSWNDENLEELWDDLYNSFVDGIDKCYFLGSIVIVDRGNGEQELVEIINENLTLDAFKREDARARIRVNIRRLLIKYNYPPVKREGAVEQVIRQAELKYAND